MRSSRSIGRSPSSFGLLFGVTAQTVGWPVARGGSQAISDALVSYLRALGGEVECNRPVNGWDDLPTASAVLFDTSPTTLLRVAGDRLPTRYAGRLRRFRHGPGSFKLDLAVEGPIPWRDERAGRAGTVHIGGTLEEVSAAERSVWRGEHPERPYVLLSQPSVVDETRAPPGKQTVWVYCHVPAESKVDMTERIEAQVERFAPGFRERVLARHAMGPAALEAHNPNNVGGDISGGAHTGLQLIARPFPSMDPYFTGTKGIYLCSSSTPPGAGVHGMCGYWAARSALKRAICANAPWELASPPTRCAAAGPFPPCAGGPGRRARRGTASRPPGERDGASAASASAAVRLVRRGGTLPLGGRKVGRPPSAVRRLFKGVVGGDDVPTVAAVGAAVGEDRLFWIGRLVGRRV